MQELHRLALVLVHLKLSSYCEREGILAALSAKRLEFAQNIRSRFIAQNDSECQVLLFQLLM